MVTRNRGAPKSSVPTLVLLVCWVTDFSLLPDPPSRVPLTYFFLNKERMCGTQAIHIPIDGSITEYSIDCHSLYVTSLRSSLLRAMIRPMLTTVALLKCQPLFGY